MKKIVVISILLLACLPLLNNKVNAEVLAQTDTSFSIKNQVVINKTSDVVWRALIDDVNMWWPKDHTWWGVQTTLSIDEFAGGCFCEKLDDKSAEHMRISFVEPEKLLRMTGGLGPLQGMGLYGALDWTFEPIKEGTKITLTYKVNGYINGGFKELAPIVAKVQGLQLNGLKTYLE